MQSLVTSASPGQMLERAALLDAAGTHRTDVVAQVTVAEKKAEATVAEAKQTLTQAATLKEQAADRARRRPTRSRPAPASTPRRSRRSRPACRRSRRRPCRRWPPSRASGPRPTATPPRRPPSPGRRLQKSAPAAPPANDTSSSTAGPGSSSAVETAIRAAQRWIGTRYAWGGGSLTGPSEGTGIDAGVIGFDCSGLTRYAYAQAGISIPRQSTAQYAALPNVSRADLQRGDLVFYAFDTSDPSTIHHVALYLGNGQMIEAPESGETVHMTAMRWGGYIGAVRPSA